jgi:hypothetical protein
MPFLRDISCDIVCGDGVAVRASEKVLLLLPLGLPLLQQLCASHEKVRSLLLERNVVQRLVSRWVSVCVYVCARD